jgi:adenosylcobyric acid synthase
MLGQELSDPEALEGRSESLDGGTVAGLGLLPLRTQFNLGKALRQRQGHSLWPPGGSLPIQGFELHHGHSTLLTTSQSSAWKVGALTEEPGLGWWSQDSQRGSEVAGTYLHGIFDNGPWRRRWLNQLRRRKGLPNLPEHQPHHSSHREVLLERLADAFEAHVDLTPLLAPP